METTIIKTPAWYEQKISDLEGKITRCRMAISAAYPLHGGRPDYGAIQACRAEIEVYETRINLLRAEKRNAVKAAGK